MRLSGASAPEKFTYMREIHSPFLRLSVNNLTVIKATYDASPKRIN